MGLRGPDELARFAVPELHAAPVVTADDPLAILAEPVDGERCALWRCERDELLARRHFAHVHAPGGNVRDSFLVLAKGDAPGRANCIDFVDSTARAQIPHADCIFAVDANPNG